MKLKNKLFVMTDDQPHLNAVAINLPEFKKLWEADKSENKSLYAKQIAYIYHMCEYESAYYDNPNKQQEVAKAFMGDAKYKPTKLVQDCIDWYNRNQFNSEKRALDGAIAACDAISNDLVKTESESVEFDNLIKEIDSEIKNADDVLTKMALMEQKLKLQNAKLTNSKTITEVIGKLKSQVEDMQDLREKVTKASYDGEISVAIDIFILDWINEVKHEHDGN